MSQTVSQMTAPAPTREEVFRFMDLPPEVRNLVSRGAYHGDQVADVNHVYTELLSRDKSENKTRLDILRVSRQVLRESRDVMLSVKDVPMTVDYHNLGMERTTVSGIFPMDITEFYTICREPHLRRFGRARSLCLTLYFRPRHAWGGKTLATFFELIAKRFTVLTKLRIDVKCPLTDVADATEWLREDIVRLLTCLRSLPKAVALEFDGLDEAMLGAVQKTINEPPEPTDVGRACCHEVGVGRSKRCRSEHAVNEEDQYPALY